MIFVIHKANSCVSTFLGGGEPLTVLLTTGTMTVCFPVEKRSFSPNAGLCGRAGCEL